MAVEAVSPPGNAQLVGMAFVQRYYNTFYQFPEEAYKFYLDFSMLSRPGPNGEMTSVTTMQGINDAILSCGSKNLKAEIYTSDAQFSHKEGIIVLVTGCLTGKDNVKRKFTQTFFLAPQDKGYFVLNDVFRYIDDRESVEVDNVVANGDHEIVRVIPSAADHISDENPVADQPILDQQFPAEVATEKETEVSELAREASIVNVKEATPIAHGDSRPNGVVKPAKGSSSSNAQVASTKTSYASMLKKVMTSNNIAVAPVHVPTPIVREESLKSEQSLRESLAPEASAPNINTAPKSTSGRREAKGCGIIIRNLPLSTRFEHIDRIFKKYGTIKQGSIQVRSYKSDETAIAFVDFETSTDMEKAIKASPIKIDGGREVIVEEKKNHFRGREKNQRNGNGFRNGYRGGNGRTEKMQDSESSGRTRGRIEIDHDGFQMVLKTGGRTARQSQ